MNYYEILGVTKEATMVAITEAKNKLAKKYHPDVHMKDGVDTTEKMQQILEAYTVLSDEKSRTDYDAEIFGTARVMQTFDLHQMKDETTGEQCYPTFLTYWKNAGKLHELLTKSQKLSKSREDRRTLEELSKEALRQAAALRKAAIPERYWHPRVMNWLLLTWSKNRNFSTSYLLTLYDSHLQNDTERFDRIKQERACRSYQRQIKKLIRG